MSDVTRVLVVDDQVLLRGSFRILIENEPCLTAVGEAGDGAEAVELAHLHRPDVVPMDVRMPVMDGIEATRRICGSHETAGVRVLILTTFDLDEYVYAALRVVAKGDSLLAPSVTRRLIREFTRRPDPDSGHRHASAALTGVTERELQVLGLIARGLSNDEIMAHLHLSMGTVKTHIGRLLSKLAARDRAQLVIAAYESGVVSPSDDGLGTH
ncbi:response regulator transcription factor [Streptomyces sp. NBC_01336]|uniref:response regulator transcription factor n=1 Tax=Streptomyces sp. NBC_01336 TaxID=2903829 RepID=UPI002E12F297|nr:response regulator transcription factor [Streptomyces sp. NBC_01336]